MRVSVCLGAILILEYLDFYSQEQNSRNIFRNIFQNKFLFRNILNEHALDLWTSLFLKMTYTGNKLLCWNLITGLTEFLLFLRELAITGNVELICMAKLVSWNTADNTFYRLSQLFSLMHVSSDEK